MVPLGIAIAQYSIAVSVVWMNVAIGVFAVGVVGVITMAIYMNRKIHQSKAN